MPDFTLTAPTPSQTLQGGLIANYLLTVSPTDGPFTGSVTFSVTGLQPGATATFLPTTVVPNASGTTTTMSIQTVALANLEPPNRQIGTYYAFLCLTPFVGLCARRRRKTWQFLALTLFLATTFGCGARTISIASTQSQSYTLAVTATSSNLAGATVAHTTSVALTVQ